MKKLILIILGGIIVTPVFAQRWDLGTSFNYTKPMGGMARNINQGFGITLEGARLLRNAPFAIGAELSYNGYGHDKTRQRYTFDDGSVTETNVVVNNTFTNVMITGKFFMRKQKLVNPYASTKAGYSWYTTNLTIEDPEDVDGCQPLESDHLLRDGTFAASVGIGMRLDFTLLFKKMRTNTLFFDFSAHMTQGGTVKYMNVDHHGSTHSPDSDVTARFINNRTQVIHEHHVGYVYNNLVEMMDYRFGVVYRPSR